MPKLTLKLSLLLKMYLRFKQTFLIVARVIVWQSLLQSYLPLLAYFSFCGVKNQDYHLRSGDYVLQGLSKKLLVPSLLSVGRIGDNVKLCLPVAYIIITWVYHTA